MTESPVNHARSAWGRLQHPAVFAPLLAFLGLVLSLAVAERGLPGNDEGAVLTAAAKILQGGVYYRDIDAYPFPGAAYLLAGVMALFGEHLSVARVLAALVYVVAIVSLYVSALRLLDRRRAALFGLSLLSFKFLAWPGFTSYMHADVSFAAACAAIALGFGPGDRGRQRLALAGACVGVSVVCKQNLGIPVAGVALALLAFPNVLLRAHRGTVREHGLDAAAFGAGLAATLLPILAYFAWHGVVAEMAYSGLVRPFTAYLATSGVSFATPLAWWKLGDLRGMDGFAYFVAPYWTMLVRNELPGPSWYSVYWMAGEVFARCLYTSVPLIFAAASWLWLRALREGPVSAGERNRLSYALFAFAVMLSVFPRADFHHLIGLYPVVLLLLFSLRGASEGADSASSGAGNKVLRDAVGVAVLLGVTATLSIVHHSHEVYRLRLERADLRVSRGEAFVGPIVNLISEELGPDDKLFVYGHEAYYYFLSGHLYPWPFSQLYPGQVGGDGGLALTDLLEREPPSLVVRGVTRWPGIPPIPSYTPVLARHLRDHFEVADDVFRRHPPLDGQVPPAWTVSVLRPRAGISGDAVGDKPAAGRGEG